MDTFSQAALVVLAMVLFANYRNGTLGDWLKAKFLNKGAPAPGGDIWGGSDSTVGGGGELASTSPDPSSSGPAHSPGDSTFLGKFLWPVGGATLTGHFGDGRNGHTHEGIDLAVPTGTAVGAAAAGRVTFAGPSAGYGLRVDIDNGNGWVTRYGHLSRLDVGVGDVLKAGDLIAKSGNTGDSTGPHLHFEIRRFGNAVDPLGYLGPVNPAAVSAA